MRLFVRTMVHRDISWLISKLLYLTTTAILASTEVAASHQGHLNLDRSELFELSVIHLNDFHARFVQTGPNSDECVEDLKDDCVGGIARVYAVSHRLVNERPNAIFLNAGDNFQGTLWYNVHRWNVTATFLNMLPQDAMTLGNHEFDDKIAGVVPFLQMSKSPVVVTNIDASDEPDMEGLYTNSTTIVRNGTKIGIIGVILSTTNTIASTENLRFLDEVETVNDEAGRLKNDKVDIIIVLSHCGLDVDRVMAARCPDVDLIVGGHSHTFLYTGTPPDTDVPADVYPIVVTQEGTDRTVLIVQAAAFTKYLGNLSVWFDGAGEVADWEGNPILLNNTFEQDPEILAALAPWQVAVDALDTVVIGSTNVHLNNNCRFGECNLGNLITDAMVDAYVTLAENGSYWTYAAIACTNSGGIDTRSAVSTRNITYGDAATHQKFANTWDVLELRGSDLIQVLEGSVINSFTPDVFIGRNFLQWSGIQVTFNFENAPYDRVTSLRVRCRDCTIPRYEEVVLDKWYRIVVPSFIVNGGDSHIVIANQHRNHEVGTLDIDHYVKYIEKMSPIIIGIEGRINIRGTWSS